MSVPEPPPLPPWFIKWLEKHPGALEDNPPPPPGYSSWALYFYSQEVGPMDFHPLGPPAPEGAKVQMIFTRSGQDVATIGLHFVHANHSIPGDTVAFDQAADAATIEGLLDTLWGSLKGYYAATFALDRYHWNSFGVGVRRPNPSFRQTLKAPPVAGTSTQPQLPEQVALGVTFKTDHRRSWGRVYMPAPTTDFNTDTGYIANDAQMQFRTSFGALLDNAAGADLPLVVWCPRRAGALLKYGAANHAADLDLPDDTSIARGVSQISVDNLWDVIRRRRFKPATAYETHTLP